MIGTRLRPNGDNDLVQLMHLVVTFEAEMCVRRPQASHLHLSQTRLKEAGDLPFLMRARIVHQCNRCAANVVHERAVHSPRRV